LLGADFPSTVKLENVFESVFGSFGSTEEDKLVCSRIRKCENKVPQYLRELFEKESRDLNEDQKDFV